MKYPFPVPSPNPNPNYNPNHYTTSNFGRPCTQIRLTVSSQDTTCMLHRLPKATTEQLKAALDTYGGEGG